MAALSCHKGTFPSLQVLWNLLQKSSTAEGRQGRAPWAGGVSEWGLREAIKTNANSKEQDQVDILAFQTLGCENAMKTLSGCSSHHSQANRMTEHFLLTDL